MIGIHAHFFIRGSNHEASIAGLAEQLHIRFHHIVMPVSISVHQLGATVIGDILHDSVNNLPGSAKSLPASLTSLTVCGAIEIVLKIWLSMLPFEIGELGCDGSCQQKHCGNHRP